MLMPHSGFEMFPCELLTGYLAVQMLFIAYGRILEFCHMVFFFLRTLMVSVFFFFSCLDQDIFGTEPLHLLKDYDKKKE